MYLSVKKTKNFKEKISKSVLLSSYLDRYKMSLLCMKTVFTLFRAAIKTFFFEYPHAKYGLHFFKPAAKLTGSQVEHFCWKFATSDLFLPSSTLPTPLFGFTNGLFLLLTVKAIIEHEARNGIPPNRIILGGFSQVVFFLSWCYMLWIAFTLLYIQDQYRKCIY